MWGKLPDDVREADRQHHAVLQRVHFSRHLNPTNAEAARRAFRKGAEAPPFSYRPLQDADEILAHLEDITPHPGHPAGELVTRCIEGTARLVTALRDRTPEAFLHMAEHAGWLPDEALLGLELPPEEEQTHEPMDVPASRMMARLEQSLAERGLPDWTVLADPVMAARVLVDSAKRLVKVSPRARFRQRDLTRLVVHEIDVHATRAMNGAGQLLRCFETGLPGALLTEEGLAMVSEEQAQVATPGSLARQQHVVWAVRRAAEVGFRQLYEELAERAGPGLAWGISLRVKRGLADPALPGVYAKDTVYLAGRMKVRAWLDAGGDIRHLYVGKVGVDDPVGEWLAEGWVRPGRVPRIWAEGDLVA